ncbi:MAG TPA: YeeE/YedE thiosulfate transporter family protein, partial [Anaerolineales bacterium]|nr:YeeE/YedE thiosulfate transporter family protein [Anaerolineales bacterium]
QYGAYLVFLVIGFFFGYALEIAGFAKSDKLAAQFYFKDLTVLKVMFTAIIVAMVGVFLASALGLLDYSLVWVNPTYLWPGIVGGLIMGVGFIVGGFCPGTSLVAVATAKIDGIFFALGVLFGIFTFGETVEYFNDFFYSSYMGRFTLMDWLGLPTGVVVLIVVLMALFMFWGGEKLEAIFGGKDLSKEPRSRVYGAAAIIVVAAIVLFVGQPSAQEKWNSLADEKAPALVDERAYQMHPAEVLSLIHNDDIKLFMLDVRPESDFNIFHIEDAQHYTYEELEDTVGTLRLEPSNAVFVVMSNSETDSTDTWKMLVAESLHNVYILEGGINYWLDVFDSEGGHNAKPAMLSGEDMTHTFDAALGDQYPAATPDPELIEEIEFTPKLKLELKKGPSGGGCG